MIDKVSAQEIATQFLLGDLIKASTNRFKALAVAYQWMSQEEQQLLLKRVEEDARRAVVKAVEIIASDARVTFRASCESVNFKPDGVKAVLTMFNSEEAHALANAAGSTVLIVIEDAQRYLEVGDATKGEPDQRDLGM